LVEQKGKIEGKKRKKKKKTKKKKKKGVPLHSGW